MAPAPKTRVTRSRIPTPKEVEVTEVVAEKPQRKMAINRSTLVMGVLLIIAIGVAGYFYYQSTQTPQTVNAKEIKELTETIGQFLELPGDEVPTLATVTDREKLAGQSFFLKAENGDKVLLYSSSGKAILYRPSTKKIVDMTSVNTNNKPTAETQAAPQPTTEVAESTIRVALLNGSQTIGVTNTVENQIKGNLSNVEVVSKDNAKKNDYAKTVVVDVTGANTESVQKIAESLDGEVGNLPEGEVAPSDADIVIIIASNKAPIPAPEEKN